MAKQLSTTGLAVLRMASDSRDGVSWSDVCVTGATASSLRALVNAGFLTVEGGDGPKTWTITDAGRAAVAASA